MTTASRPLGVTIIAIVVILSGIAQLIAAIGLLDWVHIADLPASGDASTTGIAVLIVAIINIVVGIGLFTLKRWAWYLAILAMALAVISAVFALIQHGFDGLVSTTVVTGVISLIILYYLFQERVRAAFDT